MFFCMPGFDPDTDTNQDPFLIFVFLFQRFVTARDSITFFVCLDPDRVLFRFRNTA
jgi:hypothetical protein